MDPVKHATEVFGMVTAEVTSLKAQPDLDPLQKARVVAQLCAVAMQALALCHAVCARSSNRGYDCARRRTTTTPRVTRENRPATTENYKTISGRGAAEVAEYGSDPGGDPTDRHRRGWLASPDERKLQNNFDTGAGESRGDGVETTATTVPVSVRIEPLVCLSPQTTEVPGSYETQYRE